MTEDLLAKIQCATEECKEATREAHGVLKDLRRELAEHRAFMRQAIEEMIAADVAAQVKRLGEATERAIESTTAAVHRRFDKITKILLGEEGDGPTLEEITRARSENND